MTRVCRSFKLGRWSLARTWPACGFALLSRSSLTHRRSRTASRRPARGSRGNELLADVALVADLDQLPHDRRIVDLLFVVEFRSARIAGRVDVADHVLAFFEAADHVAVHDLHVVDVEQQLHPRRADLADDVGDLIDVVALVTGMALHRVRGIARVEVFDADRDTLFLGVSGQLLQPRDAIVGARPGARSGRWPGLRRFSICSR